MWGDCVGVAVIEKLSRRQLKSSPGKQKDSACPNATEGMEMLEKDPGHNILNRLDEIY